MTSIKRELDKQSIGGAEFLNTNMQMDKMDVINPSLEKILWKQLFS